MISNKKKLPPCHAHYSKWSCFTLRLDHQPLKHCRTCQSVAWYINAHSTRTVANAMIIYNCRNPSMPFISSHKKEPSNGTNDCQTIKTGNHLYWKSKPPTPTHPSDFSAASSEGFKHCINDWVKSFFVLSFLFCCHIHKDAFPKWKLIGGGGHRERERQRERQREKESHETVNWWFFPFFLLFKHYQPSFVAYALANVPPKACLECKPARTIWTLMGLDIVMHVHMIIKMLLGHEPSFTDAAYIGRFIKMHFISVAFESLLSGKRSTAEFTRQNLELANVCATVCVTRAGIGNNADLMS